MYGLPGINCANCSFDKINSDSIDTVNVEKYVGNIQESKRTFHI